ncbi:MAG: glycosyltransferase [Candidatus Aureabacteria bacterium]|nr:glycosyltransferase [Candidatus Auribacterota bacterium]
MSLSTVIIAKNEEKDIERCLKSVSPVSDEIIFVDTGSVDRTKEIAARYTKKIFNFAWVNDFSKARNFAIEKATGDILFTLDADEALSRKDWEKFKEIKKSFPPEVAWGLSLPVRHYVESPVDYDFFSCQGEYPDMEESFFGYAISFRTLIFPSSENIRFENAIHESIDNSIKRQNGKVVKVDIPVHNYGYLKAFSQEKNECYRKLLIQEMEKDPNNFKKNYDYAHFLLTRGEENRALPYMEKAYEQCGKKPGRISYFLGVIYYALGSLEKAEDQFRSLLDIGQPGVFYYLSRIEFRKENYEESLKAVRRGLRQFKNNPFLIKSAYETYQKMGKGKMAREYLVKMKNVMRRKKSV